MNLTIHPDATITQWQFRPAGMISTDTPEHDERLAQEAQIIAEAHGQESADVWVFDDLKDFLDFMDTVADKIGMDDGETLWQGMAITAPAAKL